MLCQMKILFMAAWLSAMTSSLLASPFSDLTFEAASAKAAQTEKTVLIDFYTTWCVPCKILDQTTWKDPAVIHLLEEKTVALRIDAEKDVALAKQYKVTGFPSIVLIKADGKEIDRLEGYEDPKDFIVDFTDALAGKDAITRAKDKMIAAGTNNPIARLKYGEALAQKGKDAEALAEYLWCFDHGLEANPRFLNLRNGYLLTSIKNLGAEYPPALQALETRRDGCQTKVAAGSTDFGTVQDLIALNRTLDQDEKNLAVYDSLPAGSKIKEAVSSLLASEFLQAKRYSDVLQGTDGKSAFKQIMDRFNTMLNSLAKDDPMRDDKEQDLRRQTVEIGAQSFAALAGLKRNQDAKDLATQILKFDPSDDTRALLAEFAQRVGNDELSQFAKQLQ
jgi:thiol-disulfide isomerase/thioredoxin